jgi:hypothetical protein
MSTLTLRPNGHGSVGTVDRSSLTLNWSTAYQQVDEESLNDADYFGVTTDSTNYSVGNNCFRSFSFPSTGLESGTSINSVTLYFRVSGHHTYHMAPFFRLNSANYEGTQVSPSPENTKATYSQTYTTNPYTGAAWTLSQVDSLDAGIHLYSKAASGDSYSNAICYWFYAVIEYTIPETYSSSLGRGIGRGIFG